MKIEEGKNMNFGAERETVEKIQGSRGSRAERNLYAKMMKNLWKTIQKSMKNPCKIDARKSYANIMKNERKWSPIGSQNPLKNNKYR